MDQGNVIRCDSLARDAPVKYVRDCIKWSFDRAILGPSKLFRLLVPAVRKLEIERRRSHKYVRASSSSACDGHWPGVPSWVEHYGLNSVVLDSVHYRFCASVPSNHGSAPVAKAGKHDALVDGRKCNSTKTCAYAARLSTP